MTAYVHVIPGTYQKNTVRAERLAGDGSKAIYINQAKIKYSTVTAYERTRDRTKTQRVESLAGGKVPKTVYISQAKIKHAKTE